MSDTDRVQDKRVKAHRMLQVIDSDLMPDGAVADVTVLPAAIQPFKSVPREPAPHLVAESQISLVYFSVALLLPRLAHSEVPKQVLGNVGFERNLHEGMEHFRLGFQVLIPLVQENEIEHGNAALDEVELMVAAIAEVLLFDLAIESAREQVIHDTAFREAFR